MDPSTLRKPGPNERRCIVRHDLGFYNNIVVGGVYQIPRDSTDDASRLLDLDFYAPALARCIECHPILSATIKDAGSNNPTFARPAELDLRNHFRAIKTDTFDDPNDKHPATHRDTLLVKWAVERLHNDPLLRFTDVASKPAWSLDLVALPGCETSAHHRVFISFTYSHSHGDGLSGGIFHRTFHSALQSTLHDPLRHTVDTTIKPPSSPLLPQPDTPSNIPISLSYLLQPLLGTYLPRFLTQPLGISPSISGADGKTWTGARTFTDARTEHSKATTSIETLTVTPDTLASLLSVCRANQTTLTPLLDCFIAQAVSAALRTEADSNSSNHINSKASLKKRKAEEYDEQEQVNFVSQIPLNLRPALAADPSAMGNYAGVAFLRHERESIPSAASVPAMIAIGKNAWARIGQDGDKLVQKAATARDQPVGLLRFVKDMRAWMKGQVGGRRDYSWELSNLGSWAPAEETGAVEKEKGIGVESLLFCQPASPIGPPLAFSVAGVKRGAMCIGVSWQAGALGLNAINGADGEGEGGVKVDEGVEERERTFVANVLAKMSEGFDMMTSIANTRAPEP